MYETSAIIIPTLCMKKLSQRGVKNLFEFMQREGGRTRFWAQDLASDSEHTVLPSVLGHKGNVKCCTVPQSFIHLTGTY